MYDDEWNHEEKSIESFNDDECNAHTLMDGIQLLENNVDEKYKEEIVAFVKDLAKNNQIAATDVNVATNRIDVSLMWRNKNTKLFLLIDPPENELTTSVYKNGIEGRHHNHRAWKNENGSYEDSINYITTIIKDCFVFK